MPGRGELARVPLDELDGHASAVSFTYENAFGRTARGVLVRWHGALRAYRNLCPHWSVPLDSQDGRFFDRNASVLVCWQHGARFDPDSGECISGPCVGDHLEAFTVTLSDDGDYAIIERHRRLDLG